MRVLHGSARVLSTMSTTIAENNGDTLHRFKHTVPGWLRQKMAWNIIRGRLSSLKLLGRLPINIMATDVGEARCVGFSGDGLWSMNSHTMLL